MELLRTVALDVGIAGHKLLAGLNLVVRSGESWGLLGANGSGKTTLLHTLAGLQAVQGGSIWLQGMPLRNLPRRTIARQLALLQQESREGFPASVLETVLTGRHPHLSRWQNESTEDVRLARESLEQVGLQDREQCSCQTLSGGEYRRLAIATLLTQASPLMLLDEPVNHLDLHHQITILQHLHTRVKQESHGLLMALHDINLTARFCDHVLLLHGNGSWLAGTTDELLNAATLTRLYQHPIRKLTSTCGQSFFLPAL